MGARHVRDLGLKEGADHEIWLRSIADDAVILTRDSDFALFARQDPRGRLVWLRFGNCGNADLIRMVEARWADIAARLEAGERLVEVRPGP